MSVQTIFHDELAKLESIAETVHPGAKAEIESIVASIRHKAHEAALTVETEAQKVADETADSPPQG